MADDRLLVLLNPAAGGGRALKRRDALESALRRENIAYELAVTRSEDDLRALARDGARGGRMLVGAGGDSTFSIIAGEIQSAGADVPLGVVGLGSSNDVAREFGLETIEKACAALRRGRARTIDLGVVFDGERALGWFIGQANIGLGVAVNRYVAAAAGRRPWLARRQTLAGFLGARAALRNGEIPVRAAVEGDGNRVEGPFSVAVFSNLRTWASGRLIAPEARPDDGKLDACLIASGSLWRLARLYALTGKGRHVGEPEVRIIRSAEFAVHAEAPIEVQADGEILEAPDGRTRFRTFTIRAVPAALRIFVLS
jgi:diacylglycerol kinase (ATP)